MSVPPTGDKSGLKTALAEGFSPNDPVPGSGEAQQLPLLPLSQVVADENHAVPVSAANGSGKREPGRPAGSRNKSTKEWRDFVLSQYRSPVVVMAEMYSRNVIALAKELGFITETRRASPDEMFELLKFQMQCAKEVSPYVHQKQPLAIDAGNNGLISLVLNMGGDHAAAAAEAGPMRVNFIDGDYESDQPLSGDDFSKSAAAKSVNSHEAEPKQEDATNEPTD